LANGVPYGLSASITRETVNQAFAAMRDLFTGIVYVNAPTIGAETHPAIRRGTKQNRQRTSRGCHRGDDFYTEWKTLYIDYSDKRSARRSTIISDWVHATGKPFETAWFSKWQYTSIDRALTAIPKMVVSTVRQRVLTMKNAAIQERRNRQVLADLVRDVYRDG